VKHNYYAYYKAEREAHNRQFALAVEQCTALVKRMDVEATQHAEKVYIFHMYISMLRMTLQS